MLRWILLGLLGTAGLQCARAADAEAQQKINTAVEALTRMENVNLDEKPAIQAAVNRVLEKTRGTPNFVTLVRHFHLTNQNAGLLEVVAQNPGDDSSVEAMRLVLARHDLGAVRAALQATNATNATNAASSDSAPDQSELGNETNAAGGKLVPTDSPKQPTPGSAVYVSTRPSNNFPIPESIAQGQFEIANGCLLFIQTGASPALALMPPGSTISTSAAGASSLSVGGRRISLGQTVSVNGGPIPSGAEREYGHTGQVPSSCPRRVFAVGGFQ